MPAKLTKTDVPSLQTIQRLITWLMMPDPDQRPTMRQVLDMKHGWITEKMYTRDELKDAVKAIKTDIAAKKATSRKGIKGVFLKATEAFPAYKR